MPIETLLTPNQPFGPIDQSDIEDPADTLLLLDGAPAFLSPLEHRAALVIGRKGSGKSSIIAGYKNKAQYGRYCGASTASPKEDRDIVVPILA